MSTAAKAHWLLTTQSAIKLMQWCRGVMSAGGILSNPPPHHDVPSPGYSLSQGHSGSAVVRPTEETAFSHHVLWDEGPSLAPQGIISGMRGLPREHGVQTSWLLSHSAAVHIWSSSQKPFISTLS